MKLKNTTTKRSIIIVGGGTAGSVICSKLESEFEVLVFEKSAKEKIPLLNRIPLLIGLLYGSKNNYIKTTKLEYGKNRTVPLFESKSLYGSSAINGCVHVIGIYSKWKRFLEKFDLDLKDMEESCARTFATNTGIRKIILRRASQTSLDIAFQDSLESLGVKRGPTDIMNEQTCGAIVNTTKMIFRSSVADLKPFYKANIKLNKKVTNLVVGENGKVVGVVADGKTYISDYVILTAGVIGTNELLLRPAIRANDKEKVKLNLKVGIGIKDHVNFRINISSSQKIDSLNIINRNIFKKLGVFIKHVLGFDTLLSGTGATSSANLDLNGDGVVDTRINLLKFSENGRMGSGGKYFDGSNYGYSLSISSINPISEGMIELLGSDEHSCRIWPNYLHNPQDQLNINKAFDFAMSILKTPPMADYVLSIKDEHQILNNRESYLNENIYSGYHLIGGCHKIIDKDFRVRDLENLYICDASIFDEYVSSNIHAPVVVMADLFAKKFLRQRSSS